MRQIVELSTVGIRLRTHAHYHLLFGHLAAHNSKILPLKFLRVLRSFYGHLHLKKYHEFGEGSQEVEGVRPGGLQPLDCSLGRPSRVYDTSLLQWHTGRSVLGVHDLG